MNDMTTFEQQFEDRVRAFARAGVRPVDSSALARAVAAGHPRSARAGSVARGLGFSFDRRALALVLALGLLVALLGGVLLIGAGLVPPTLVDTRISPRPSQDQPAVVAPSSTPSATAPTAPAFARTTGVWIATGTMGTPRSDHTAVRLLDGRVLVMGGAAGEEDDTSAELYDPETGTWSATGSMVRPRGGFAFAAILLRDGKVLVGDEKGAEVFDPDVGTWTVTKKMALIDEDGSSHWGKATLLRDGRVLVVHDGGISEVYDPDSGTWTATGQLTPPVDIPTPVTLPDGKVLVAGGDDTSRDGDRAALYDPATGTWIATGTMGTPRIEHLVVPLLDGRVLVVGGANDDQRRYVRGGVRPGQRDLVRHREHAQAPHSLPGHRAARRQGARRGCRRRRAVRPRQRDLDGHREDGHAHQWLGHVAA